MTFLGPGSFAFMGTFQIPLYDKHDNVVAHATVDEQDFARLSHLRFTALRTKSGIYGVQFRAVNGSTEATLLHRLVLGDPPFDGAEVDHRNRNTLDTRRENLRWVTHAQNLQNRPSQKNATSAHRGVHWDRCEQRWVGEIRREGRRVWRRYFRDQLEAAVAVSAARRVFLPFSVENGVLAS